MSEREAAQIDEARAAGPPAWLVWLLSVGAGVGVASLYYAQPLGAAIAADLRVPERSMGVALTLTQAGYALGMLLLVPLGDGRERRGLIVVTAGAGALTLLAYALSPSFEALAATSLLLGAASSLPQMLVPYGVTMAGPRASGQVLGTIMGGLLAGVLLSRTASGALAQAIGWRTTFGLAAGLQLGLAVTLRAALPEQHPESKLAYRQIVASLLAVARDEPTLRRHSLVGAAGFAAFSAFWSMLSFHLATLGHGPRTAGLFGAVGLVGVVVAPVAGRLATRVPPSGINAAGLALALAGFGLFSLGRGSLLAIAAGVVLLDAGVQASHLANQTVVLGLRPALRNRMNAVYMVSYFVGGAAGSAAAAFAWSARGWTGVCATGALCCAAGLLAVALRPRAASAGKQ